MKGKDAENCSLFVIIRKKSKDHANNNIFENRLFHIYQTDIFTESFGLHWKEFGKQCKKVIENNALKSEIYRSFTRGTLTVPPFSLFVPLSRMLASMK